MSRTLETRLVRLEGVDSPCVLVLPPGELPEELVLNFGGTNHITTPRTGPTTFRLEPSTAEDPEPLYRELFDE